MAAAPTVWIRPAEEFDMPQVQQILEYYVRNTTTTFRHTPTTLEYEIAQLRNSRRRGWPYLVATEAHSTGTSDASGRAERILGYANLSPFRASREGYMCTAELTIFVHHEHARQGRVGPALLSALLEVWKERNKRLRADAKDVSEGAPVDGEVRQIIACMSADDREPERDAAVKRFYERQGFEERSTLKRVGWKFGRWIDTRYLQLEL